jgi:hypothetical protein
MLTYALLLRSPLCWGDEAEGVGPMVFHRTDSLMLSAKVLSLLALLVQKYSVYLLY